MIPYNLLRVRLSHIRELCFDFVRIVCILLCFKGRYVCVNVCIIKHSVFIFFSLCRSENSADRLNLECFRVSFPELYKDVSSRTIPACCHRRFENQIVSFIVIVLDCLFIKIAFIITPQFQFCIFLCNSKVTEKVFRYKFLCLSCVRVRNLHQNKRIHICTDFLVCSNQLLSLCFSFFQNKLFRVFLCK